MADEGFVHYDFTGDDEMISGSHLEQHVIMVEPVRGWGDRVLDALGPHALGISSFVSGVIWLVAVWWAWCGINAAGWLEAAQ
jgi:hypothetical protein